MAHKEHIKEMSRAVDVLTLSATPIPRTLNMALSGIRDMSTIEEPPQDRIPVQTFVMEHDWNVLCDAMRRELQRGGQVFYLHNRIENIERTALRISKMLDGAVVDVAHGQMNEEQLSTVMERMVAGEQFVQDTVDQTIRNVVGDGGTEAQLNEKLQSYYMDLDLFKYFTKVQYLYNALAEKLFGADGASITDEDVQEFAEANSYTTAKHILLKTIDDSGKAIADDEKAAKKQKADKIAAQLKAVTDPQQRAELFDELMAEYNEDTGENSYPHGYCFTSGSMVTEFEDACKELEPYEVSGVVESKYGYHIILRMPTQGDDLVMSSNGTSQTLRQLVAQQQLGSLVTGWVGEADVQWQPKFRTVDYAAVLTPKESFWRRLDIFDWFDQ